MIIKAKSYPRPIFLMGAKFISWVVKRRFNKLSIDKIAIKPNHSYLLMCNHFSFIDGFLANYLCVNLINKQQPIKGIYIMVLKKQMQMNPWLRFLGCFSVSPGKANVNQSLDYAAQKLNEPGNVVIMFPQGNLESCHVRKIETKEGINHIISNTKNNCQLIWSSNLVEYFESTKPSVYFHPLDCGTNTGFEFEKLKQQINKHHQQALKSQLRFTFED
ncbi:1-acyl-sn-glycerol-3-phosphate acyltransferase [Pelobium manganitolerans]|uniref:1-acyl-sn-glycerol-3-phosphate acyltransferase n=1 Tax=Pelobium manganitolerans TaxID=1842495 RepID=UPI003FA346E1